MIQLSSVQAATNLEPAILAFTEELFGNPANMVVKTDPELPDSEYLAIEVATSAEVADIVRLNKAWHRKLLEVAGSAAHHFCLSLKIT